MLGWLAAYLLARKPPRWGIGKVQIRIKANARQFREGLSAAQQRLEALGLASKPPRKRWQKRGDR